MFSCIRRMTSSWFSEPPLTPMRTGLPWSTAIRQIVENCSSRRLPVPTLPGLIRYLSSAAAHAGYLRQQEVAVVVEVADERSRAARQLQPPLDGRHRLGGFGQVDGYAQQSPNRPAPVRDTAAPWSQHPPCRCCTSTGRRQARRHRPERRPPLLRPSCDDLSLPWCLPVLSWSGFCHRYYHSRLGRPHASPLTQVPHAAAPHPRDDETGYSPGRGR